MTHYEAAIVDLDGTVYRGDNLIPNAEKGIRTLRRAGIDVLFVSNKPVERRTSYARKLTNLGVPARPEQIVTSATVTAAHLAEHEPGRTAYVVGEEALVAELREVDLTVTSDPEQAAVVIASMDRRFDYATLTDAMEAMDDETLFVATNPDRTCPVADGEIPDAAGMIGAIEGVTGHNLDRLMGKPSTVMVEAAMRRIDAEPENCILIGDRLGTDITMGAVAGMTTALVLTGVTDAADVDSSDVTPDYVLDSLGDISEVL